MSILIQILLCHSYAIGHILRKFAVISYSIDCRFLPVSCSFSITLGNPTSGFLPAFKGGGMVGEWVVVVTWLDRAEATSCYFLE